MPHANRARPVPTRPSHRPFRRGLGSDVLRMLLLSEQTYVQISTRMQGLHPGETVPVEEVLASLLRRRLVAQDGVHFGLTARGHVAATALATAATVRPELAHLHQAAAEILDADGPVAAQIDAELDHRGAAVCLPSHAAMLTTSPPRLAASAADLAPAPIRPGAAVAAALPSRMGNTLRWRDGRITDLDGNPLPSTTTERTV